MDGQRRSGRNRASWRAECPTSLSPIMWIDHRAFGENLERRRCTGHSDVEVLGVHQVSLRDDHMVVLQALSEPGGTARSEEHTSEFQSLMRISYAVFCLKKKIQIIIRNNE